MRAIFGLDPIASGKMYLEGKEITNKNPRAAIKKGICMVNDDRKNYGLCLFRSIRENISLPNLPEKQKGLLINQKREKQECEEVARRLTVKAANIEHNGFSMSGGNQQKVLLAKWLATDPKILILDEPTRGIDVGAKSEIYSPIERISGEGASVIIISSEIPEVQSICDRIAIMKEGEVVKILQLDEFRNAETILKYSIGG